MALEKKAPIPEKKAAIVEKKVAAPIAPKAANKVEVKATATPAKAHPFKEII
jgi:hypothetical protein